MDDLKEKTDQYKDQFMDQAASVDQKGKFFTYSKPLTDAIDDGTFFTRLTGILYYIIAALFLVIPLYAAYEGIDNKIFKGKFVHVILSLIGFAAITVSCWFSFQIFFNRKKQIDNLDRNKGYLASSITSNFTRTIGECIGVFYAIAGTSVSLFGLLIDGGDNFLTAFYIGGMGGGIVDVLFFPVAAFLIILFSRFLSEIINATADIARNTKR
ncbi:hypothetical protein OAJ56_01030 [Flavobacteriales bacterium]|nr:hypothetical protein [Flavobacteriales bacterium]